MPFLLCRVVIISIRAQRLIFRCVETRGAEALICSSEKFIHEGDAELRCAAFQPRVHKPLTLRSRLRFNNNKFSSSKVRFPFVSLRRAEMGKAHLTTMSSVLAVPGYLSHCIQFMFARVLECKENCLLPLSSVRSCRYNYHYFPCRQFSGFYLLPRIRRPAPLLAPGEKGKLLAAAPRRNRTPGCCVY